MASITYMPDTNFLLQCKHPSELPWDELTKAEEIRLVVLPEVVREIDRHKSGGNARRARRAREWTGRFRTARHSDRTLELQPSGPRVLVVLAVPTPLLPDASALLGDSGDGRMVREALAWRAAEGAEQAALLTDDGGAADLAATMGLPVVEIPLERDDRTWRWRSEPEPDPRDKEIRQLKAQVDALMTERPSIAVEFLDGDGNRTPRLNPVVDRYTRLTDQQVNEALAAVLQRWPEAKEFIQPSAPPPDSVAHRVGGYPTIWHAPDQGAIERYRQGRSRWESAVQLELRKLGMYLDCLSSVIPLTIRLTNTGNVSATNLSVGIEVSPGLAIIQVRSGALNGAQGIRLVPKPPKAPEGRYIGMLDFPVGRPPINQGVHPYYPPLIKNLEVDEIRWRKVPSTPVPECELLCPEFRHRVGPDDTLIHLVVLSRASKPIKGVITVTAHATNAPDAVRAFLPCQISFKPRDTMEAALAAIARGAGETPSAVVELVYDVLKARKEQDSSPPTD